MLRAALPLFVTLFFVGCGDDPPAPIDPAAAARAATPGTVEFINAAADRIRAARSGPQEFRDPALVPAQKLLQQERFREARAFLEPIHKDHPESLWTTYMLGITHHKEKRYAEALPYFETVLAGRPAFPSAEDVLYLYGWAEYYLGRTDVARAAFDATLRLKPQKADAEFGIGLCDIEDGKPDDAARHFQAVIASVTPALEKGDPNAAEYAAKAHARIGDVCELNNDVEGARRHYEECVKLNPSAYEAWMHLSKLLERQGDKDGSAAARAQADHWHSIAERNRKGQ